MSDQKVLSIHDDSVRERLSKLIADMQLDKDEEDQLLEDLMLCFYEEMK